MGPRKTTLYTKIVVILSSILLNAHTAAADDYDPVGAAVGVALNFLVDLVKQFGEYLFGWIGQIAAGALNALIIPFKAMILWNPDPSSLTIFVEGMVELLIPAYIILIMVTGIYLIFVSVSPASRARAKSMFWKLILSMVLVTLSMEIYEILLGISGALSERALAGIVIEESFLVTALATAITLLAVETGFVLPISYLVFVLLAAIIVGLRAFLVYLMAALFPITLFLYFFDLTKGIGEKLLRYTIMAIFTQVVQAFVLAVTILAVNSAGETLSEDAWGALFCVFISIGGFLMIFIAPLMTLGVLKWIGGAMAMVGSVLAFVPGMQVAGAALTAAGGVAAGMGPGGLIAGGTVYGLGKAYTMSLGPCPGAASSTSGSSMPDAGMPQQGRNGYNSLIGNPKLQAAQKESWMNAGTEPVSSKTTPGGSPKPKPESEPEKPTESEDSSHKGGGGGDWGEVPEEEQKAADSKKRRHDVSSTVGKAALATAVGGPVGTTAYLGYKSLRYIASTGPGQRATQYVKSTRVGQAAGRVKDAAGEVKSAAGERIDSAKETWNTAAKEGRDATGLDDIAGGLGGKAREAIDVAKSGTARRVLKPYRSPTKRVAVWSYDKAKGAGGSLKDAWRSKRNKDL